MLSPVRANPMLLPRNPGSFLPAMTLLAIGFVTATNASERETAAGLQGTVARHPASAVVALEHDPRQGKEIYARLCSACHGADGRGSRLPIGKSVPARDLTSMQARRELTRERMIRSVTDGRQGTAMGGFRTRLTAQEIEAVVDYVRREFMAAGPKKPRSARRGMPADDQRHPTASARAA